MCQDRTTIKGRIARKKALSFGDTAQNSDAASTGVEISTPGILTQALGPAPSIK